MLFKNRVQIAWPWKTSNPSPRGSGSTPRSMQKHVKQYGCFLTMARSSSRKTIVFEQNLCFILVVTTVLQNTTRGYECRKSPGSKPCSHLSSCERWSTVFVWLEVIRIWWVYYIIYIYIYQHQVRDRFGWVWCCFPSKTVLNIHVNVQFQTKGAARTLPISGRN